MSPRSMPEAPPPDGDPPVPEPGAGDGPVLTVSEVCDQLRELAAELAQVSVRGEVQSLHTSARGHKYFDIVEGGALLNVKMWSSVAVKHTFKDGDDVIVGGGFDFYPPRGALSLIARRLSPTGEGSVLARLEATRRRLEADGLFAGELKRPLPLLPRAIGVVCGTDAAVKKDIEAARAARFPGYPIVWREALVSGDAAVDSLIEALAELGKDDRVDVVLLARGGGSFDDLLPFSDERLCRAVAECRHPVVSAVGHEGDAPLCDLVADLRCSTPTRAGWDVIPSHDELEAQADGALDAVSTAIRSRLVSASARIEAGGARLAQRSPGRTIETLRERLRALAPDPHLRSRVRMLTERLRASAAALSALSPESTLERGYAVIWEPAGGVVVDPSQAPEGTPLEIRVARGTLAAESKGGVTDD